jgi:hypothetical protein
MRVINLFSDSGLHLPFKEALPIPWWLLESFIISFRVSNSCRFREESGSGVFLYKKNCLILIFYIFLNYFDMIILKIILKN